MSTPPSMNSSGYDTKFIAHIGIEILALAGIGFYFHRKTMNLDHENQMLKNQLRELSEKVANSNNPLLKRDDLHNQVRVMEDAIVELNSHIENIKKRLSEEYRSLQANDTAINQLGNLTQSLTDVAESKKNNKAVETVSKSNNEDIPQSDVNEIDSELKSLDTITPSATGILPELPKTTPTKNVPRSPNKKPIVNEPLPDA